jgi:hypothetical protein
MSAAGAVEAARCRDEGRARPHLQHRRRQGGVGLGHIVRLQEGVVREAGVAQAKRRQHQPVHERRIGLARRRLHDGDDQDPVGDGIVEPGAGLEDRIAGAEALHRLGRAHGRAVKGRIRPDGGVQLVRNAAGVVQQVAQGDLPPVSAR